MDQELYEEDVKVVILPDRQEVTSDDLATMPDVVKERVRNLSLFDSARKVILRTSPIWLITFPLYYYVVVGNMVSNQDQVIEHFSSISISIVLAFLAFIVC